MAWNHQDYTRRHGCPGGLDSHSTCLEKRSEICTVLRLVCSGRHRNPTRPKTETATESAGASNRKTIVDLSQKTQACLCLYFHIFTSPSIWRFPSSFLFYIYIFIFSRLVSVPLGWECVLYYALPSSCFMWRLWSPCTLISIKSGLRTSLPFSSFSGSFLRLQKHCV